MRLIFNKLLTAVLCGIAVSVFISGAHEYGRLYQNYLREKFLSEDELNWNARDEEAVW